MKSKITEFKDLFAHLTKEMQGKVDNKLGNKTSKAYAFAKFGWPRIPNCRRMEIKLGKTIPQVKKLIIDFRTPTTVKIEPYLTKGMNQYLFYQTKKLWELRTDPIRFWKKAFWLLRKSMVFRVSAINRVFHNWHRNAPLWQIYQINKEVQRILDEGDDQLKYKRVYIPKGESDFRPLGVPTPAWRVVLHMWNNMLDIYLTDHKHDSQHGFIQRRGTLSAWRALIPLLNKDWIYECDLKQFFSSVRIEAITEKLLATGMPPALALYFEGINRCQPILPTELKLDESKYIKYQTQRSILTDYYSDQLLNPTQALSHSRYYMDSELWGAMSDQEGVPQGAATSPGLSTLLLTDFLNQQTCVAYADDPIFFGDKEFRIKDDPYDGIILHPDKSGWVKRDGVWLKPLKYLGLIYNPLTNTVSGATRKGSTLEFEIEERDKLLELTSETKHSYKSWRTMFSTKIMGLIQSRLYAGDFQLKDLEQDFRLTFSSHSWTSKFMSEVRRKINPSPGEVFNGILDITNSSSYACYSLYYMLDSYNRKKCNRIIRKHVSMSLTPRLYKRPDLSPYSGVTRNL